MSPDHEATPETKADMLLRFGYYITIVFIEKRKSPYSSLLDRTVPLLPSVS